MAQEQNQQPQQQIQIKMTEPQEIGVYSNAVSVHLNQNELIVDFGYILPNQNQQAPMTIKLVSRVNMSHQTAESFLSILSNALLDWKNRQKKS